MAKKKTTKKTSKKTSNKTTKKAGRKAAKKAGSKKKKSKSVKKKSSQKKASKKRPGLYVNIHKAQRRAKRGGKSVRQKGEAGAPSDSAFSKAKKTAKKK